MAIFNSYVKLPEGTILFDDGFLSPTLSNLMAWWWSWWILLDYPLNIVQLNPKSRGSAVLLHHAANSRFGCMATWQLFCAGFLGFFSVDVLLDSVKISALAGWRKRTHVLIHLPFGSHEANMDLSWSENLPRPIHMATNCGIVLVPPCSDPRIILLANYPMIKYHKSTWSWYSSHKISLIELDDGKICRKTLIVNGKNPWVSG